MDSSSGLLLNHTAKECSLIFNVSWFVMAALPAEPYAREYKGIQQEVLKGPMRRSLYVCDGLQLCEAAVPF